LVVVDLRVGSRSGIVETLEIVFRKLFVLMFTRLIKPLLF
jgi:hypothetical protein